VTTTAAALDRERIGELCLAMTAIPSPTGFERPLAEWIVGHLDESGISAELHVFDETRANVVARRRGTGEGLTLLMYSPIDTAFPVAGDPADPGPMEVDPPLAPRAGRSGDWIVGSGAENPKGFATAVLSAFEALWDPGIELRGDVMLALTAGGMPSPGLRGRPETAGLGRGCREFLATHERPDAALIAKPGDAVSVEEAGIAIFRLRVVGDLAYTGTRHRSPGRHAVLDAARLVEHLEGWFPTYTAAGTTATVAPQGAVTAIAGGWPSQPAFLPAVCDVWVDLRLAPGVSLDEVEAALRASVEEAAARLKSDVIVERQGGFPGAATPRDAWIVRSAIRAWEARSGRMHVEATETSGVTDASILRGYGIPTARIGMPRPIGPSPYPGFSMGVVHLDAMTALARTVYDIALDSARQRRSEVVPDAAVATEVGP
jgi:succinyl-diaminopimelate desuccinylase